MAASDATLLLELLDDRDEVELLMMMVQEYQGKSQITPAITAAVIQTLSHRDGLTLLQKNARDIYVLPESEFFSLMHVTKKTFNFLLEIMDRCYRPVHRGGTRPNDSLCVLILALRYLASNLTYSEISKQLGTSSGSVYMALKTMVDIFCKVAPEFLHWPNKDELTEIENGFKSKTGLPGVVGSLADIQIKFKYSATEGPLYLGKDNSSTIHVLGICSDKSAFTYINIGYPGSTEEQEVLTSSSFFTVMEENPLSLFTSDDQCIVANSAFPASKHILVPFRDMWHLSDEQVDSNQRLFQAGLVIGQAFGQLKARFPRLNYFDAELKNIPKIVKTCCVLHNITLNFPGETGTLGNKSTVDALMPEEATLAHF